MKPFERDMQFSDFFPPTMSSYEKASEIEHHIASLHSIFYKPLKEKLKYQLWKN